MISKRSATAPIQGDAFAAGALKDGGGRKGKVPAVPADIPITATLRHHGLEVTLLDAVGATNCPGLG